MASAISRPDVGEYAPYYEKYVSLVTSDDIVETLASQLEVTETSLRAIAEEQAGHRYAEGKWSVRELVGHMIDTERIFAYRALRFSRNDANELPGFDQDLYVDNGPYEQCRLADLIDEFISVRRSTVSLFRNLQPEAWGRRGVASQNIMSVRALAFVTAGHELHHMAILRERYLLS